VAIWRWCSASYVGTWQYKKDKKCRAELAKLMSRRTGKNLTDASEDEIDAWTAWYLARCWLDHRGVMLLGNARTGSFLLPDEPNLQKRFADVHDNTVRGASA
jgi:hypothetical protein